MKIEKEFLEDHQVKLTVELDPAPFEKAKHQAARKIAQKVKIPGFRPGKAPYGVILRQVGEGHIVEDALEILIDEVYPEILKEAEIEPFGPGSLKEVVQLDPPTFEFLVPLEAEVELGDYKSLSFPYEAPEISDEDIDKVIEEVREHHATRESVDRPAEEGDIVFIRVSGKRLDVEDEAEAEIVKERFFSAIIQTDEKAEEWPFPGFSAALVGVSVEEEKTIPYQYPDDYEDENLRGAKAEFQVSVTNVQSRALPEADDELAKLEGEFETLEALREDIRSDLEKNSADSYDQEYDQKIIDQVVAESVIKYPPQMIEHEKEEILRGLDYRLSQQGLSKDLYLQFRGIDGDALDAEVSEAAEKRVKQALVLIDIARAENLQIDPNQVQAETSRTFEALSSRMTPNEAKKLAKSQYVPSLVDNIVADLLTQKTVDYLRATAKGEPWPVEAEETEIEADEAVLEEDSQPEAETPSEEAESTPEAETEAPVMVESTPEEEEMSNQPESPSPVEE